MKLTLTVFICILLASCSNQQVYNAGLQMEQSRCAKEPANVYQECMERNELSYEEYRNLRENPEQGKP